MADRLEVLRDRGHRTSVRLMSVAGLVTGLLLGIGWLFVDSSLRTAVAMWALMLAVSGTIVILAVELKHRADDIFASGFELHTLANDSHRQHVDTANTIGELRSRITTLERELADLRSRAQVAEASAVPPTRPVTPRPVGRHDAAAPTELIHPTP